MTPSFNPARLPADSFAYFMGLDAPGVDAAMRTSGLIREMLDKGQSPDLCRAMLMLAAMVTLASDGEPEGSPLWRSFPAFAADLVDLIARDRESARPVMT